MGNLFYENITVDLIDKYNVPSPYYTSYPTHGEWSETFSREEYEQGLKQLGDGNSNDGFTLYLHFPFCARQCFYCICNSIISRNPETHREFSTYLLKELDLLEDLFTKHSVRPIIREIHLGGGSPNLMETQILERIIARIRRLTSPDHIAEFALEVDLRTVTRDLLQFYRELGIDRISLGIQDFDPNVQKAINRKQPPEMFEDLFTPDLRQGFKSINFDLLYGLPLQTRATFEKTLDTVVRLSPDRITLLKYAHVPDHRAHQRLIKETDLPGLHERAMIFVDSVHRLVEAGYEFIGIDHFAKPADELAVARRQNKMWRDVNGFHPGRTRNLLGVGPTSTAGFANVYAQNVYALEDYYRNISENKLPLLKGYTLGPDQVIRREIMFEILCYNTLRFSHVEKTFNLTFEAYFKPELESLKPLIDDGMVERNSEGLKITPRGRFFIQHVCKVFDRFLRGGKTYRISGP